MSRLIAVAVAVLGNGLGAVSFLWQDLNPLNVLFGILFGWSTRWAADEIINRDRASDPRKDTSS